MTLKNDEASPKTFVIPRDLFLATYNAMMRSKELKDGETHHAELKTQSELISPETEKKKKTFAEKIAGFQAGARKIADGMEQARAPRA